MAFWNKPNNNENTPKTQADSELAQEDVQDIDEAVAPQSADASENVATDEVSKDQEATSVTSDPSSTQANSDAIENAAQDALQAEADANPEASPAQTGELAEAGQAAAAANEAGADEEDRPFARHNVVGKKSKAKKTAKITGIAVAAVLVAAYGGGCYYFHDHFGFKTTINDVNCSYKTVEEVTELVEQQVEDYELTIVEREDGEETIVGSDIDLVYVEDGQIQQMLHDQNMFKWPVALFKGRDVDELHASVDYDAEALANQIHGLSALQDDNMKAPVNAYPEFDGASWVVHPEYVGTVLDKDTSFEAVQNAVIGTQNTVDLEAAEVYTNPEITSTNEDLLNRIQVYNDTIPFCITYHFGDEIDSVPPETMMSWIIFQEDGSWYVDGGAVASWLRDFGFRHDTVGKARTFVGADGEEHTVEGGTYGWSTNETAEYDAIMASFETKEAIDREPYWVQTAESFGEQDWGTSYIDLNLTKQHVWVVIDGEVQFEADVVTGLPIPSRETSPGAWYVMEKMRNKVLTGDIQANGEPEYRTPVSYWVRMTGTGMGFHDASWQPWFGGDRYTYAGSHGCINMSYNDVATLYDLVWEGMPIISHY